MAEPDLMVTFASGITEVVYDPHDDVVVCPLSALEGAVGLDLIRAAVQDRWRLS